VSALTSQFPAVRLATAREVVVAFVVTSLVVKKLVEVALVVVLFTAVKFWRVEELRAKRLPRVARPELLRVVEKRFVEKKLVVVAWVVVERSATKPPVKVELAAEMKPFRKPRVVEVETPHDWTVQANGEPPESVPQKSEPLVEALTSQFAAFKFRTAREVVVAFEVVAF